MGVFWRYKGGAMAQGHENKGNKTKEKKEIKDNKQRQNVGEHYGGMTAKMGGGHLHTDPARQNRQGLAPPPLPFHQ